jgi:cellulose synthase/poly-beta-1,6-N-acetylglucosamine synthase-like glycosyltransferase
MAITYDDNAIEVCEAPAEEDAGNSESGLADVIQSDPVVNTEREPDCSSGENPNGPTSFSEPDMEEIAETDASLVSDDLLPLQLAFFNEPAMAARTAPGAGGEAEPAAADAAEPDLASTADEPQLDLTGSADEPELDLADTADEAEYGDTEFTDAEMADTDLADDDADAEEADSTTRADSTSTVTASAAAAETIVLPPVAPAPPPGYMQTASGAARLDPVLAKSGFGYERYTSLAGPLTPPPSDQPYRVQFRTIHSSKREWLATRIITLSLVGLDIRFMYWLIFQSQYPHLQTWLWQSSVHALATDGYVLIRALMAAGSIVMQMFLLINVLTVSRACVAARDPVPVEPDPKLRVAFLTTIVPDREPLELAERTLRAAREIAYAGKLDLWLLDEGDSDQAKEICRQLGVHHFSRKGRGYLELETGTFASKTKHGNHNRWLWEHAGDYDVVMFVDTDHVPLPIMAERLLGYFRDPDVAFVVAPQFYGNTGNRITRWAESAQYLFHSVIQRAGNRRNCAMLVGTNAAVRTSAIRHGYVASITEDMATSLKIHTTKSDVTGRSWRSVYTPDLVAVGEGPATWTEFFGQQTRWAAGTYDALARQVWKMIFRLRPGAMLHYLLMLTYYPSVAIGWLMGITISACYLGFGISSLRTNEGWWLTYYIDVAALQFLLYRFMRRHNVSPHEPAGSSGISGMVVSALTAPVYARALVKVLLGRKLAFNVTAKGSSAPTDRLGTFRYSLIWALVPVFVLTIALTRHRPYPMMIGWTAIILAVCLAPVLIWRWDSWHAARGERRRTAPASEPPAQAEPNLTSAASF